MWLGIEPWSSLCKAKTPSSVFLLWPSLFSFLDQLLILCLDCFYGSISLLSHLFALTFMPTNSEFYNIMPLFPAVTSSDHYFCQIKPQAQYINLVLNSDSLFSTQVNDTCLGTSVILFHYAKLNYTIPTVICHQQTSVAVSSPFLNITFQWASTNFNYSSMVNVF